MKQKGYIAITSAILISIVLMAIILTVSSIGFRGRANIFDSYSYAKSKYASEACLETALLKLVENPDYTGNETINIYSNQCNILDVVEVSPTERLIQAESIVLTSKTNLSVTVDINDFSIISWQEN